MWDDDTDWKEKFSRQNIELKNLQKSYENILQDNYSLKKNIAASHETINVLSEELETCETRHLAEKAQLEKQWSDKVEVLKKQNQDLKEANREIELRVDKLSERINFFESEEKKHSIAVVHSPPKASLEDSYHLEEIVKYKECVGELENELQEAQQQIKTVTIELEELKERYEYLDSNLSAKKEELEEKMEQVDNLQATNMELTLEINNLRSSAAHSQKGNSLFAEVDDQRQQFRQRLEEQKQQFSQVSFISSFHSH